MPNDTADKLVQISTATISMQLLKRGIRRCYIEGSVPLTSGYERVAGPAFTIRFVPMREEITTSYAAGQEKEITLHDGSVVHLHKTSENYDPYDKEDALHHMNQHKKEGKIATGLLYINQSTSDLHELQDTVDKPFNSMNEAELCPGNEALRDINDTFR